MQNIPLSEFITLLIAGCDRVIDAKEQVNSINVFPVPDQDTGSNMAATLTALKEELSVIPSGLVLSKAEGVEGSHVQEAKEIDSFLRQAQDKLSQNDKNKHNLSVAVSKAFRASQGNSGMIMTSFLRGFLEKVGESISFTDLSHNAKKGLVFARDSIGHPKPGTILDVIEAFAQSVGKNDLRDIIMDVHHALVATEKKMEILSDYHVVDAGALGFYLFILGMYEAYSGENLSIEEFVILPSKKISSDTPLLEKYPYEVISIISGCILTHEEVANLLNEMGDSLEVIEFQKKMKIHIHTAHAAEVSDAMEALGVVESLDVTDMREGVTHH